MVRPRSPIRLLGLMLLAVPAVAGTASELLPLAEIVARARAAFPGELVEAELERDDGRAVYEVEIRVTDGSKVELDIDARTGEILRSRTEQDEAHRLRATGTIVPLETIVAAAEARFSARFLEAELEDDDGGYRYEIELVDAHGRKLEAVFDAATGVLIEVEAD